MRKLHRIMTLLLPLCLILSLVCCAPSNPQTTTEAPAGTTDPGSVDTEPKQVSLSVNGVGIENYVIIYATHPYGRATHQLFTEYDFYRLIAEHVCDQIEAQTGVKLKIGQDSKVKASDYEILVGPTNRDESEIYDAMNVSAYKVALSGTKLAVGGGYNSTKLTGNLKTSYVYGSTYHAWDSVSAYITEHSSEGTEVSLPEGFSLSGKAPLKTIACIGDSITEGFASTDANVNAYPAALQRLLWKDYIVINYGNSGRTMRNDLSDRYKGTSQYRAAIQYAKSFDMALIMLGTNDSDRVKQWTETDDKAFNDSAVELVTNLTKSNKDMKIIIMNCPAYYGNGTSASSRICNLQKELVNILTEKGFNTGFYDMRKYTAKELGSAHYPDQLHPDNEGYYLMAKGLAEVLPGMLSEENG